MVNWSLLIFPDSAFISFKDFGNVKSLVKCRAEINEPDFVFIPYHFIPFACIN